MIMSVPEGNGKTYKSDDSDINDNIDKIKPLQQQYRNISELAIEFKILCDNVNENRRRILSQKSDDNKNYFDENYTDDNNSKTYSKKLKKTNINRPPLRCIIIMNPDTNPDKDIRISGSNKSNAIYFLNNMGKSMISNSYGFIYIDIYITYNSYLSLLLVWFDSLVNNGILIGSRFSNNDDDGYNNDNDNGNHNSNLNDNNNNDNYNENKISIHNLHIIPAVETFAKMKLQSLFTTYDEFLSIYCKSMNNNYRFEECSAGWYIYKMSPKSINI